MVYHPIFNIIGALINNKPDGWWIHSEDIWYEFFWNKAEIRKAGWVFIDNEALLE